ncbi:subtilisin [Deinobacterium chartae]|uniref:Subtilisin n=1 Tax=Deinobacterium chartae TaxID=521158 RepID=A0A841HWV7_9DEIO|nr:subtilisin [Deinobacterium chartae]
MALTNLSTRDVSEVNLQGRPVPFEVISENRLRFKVPEDVDGGPQSLRISGGRAVAVGSLSVLGDVEPDRVMVVLRPGVTQQQLNDLLVAKGLPVTGPDTFRDLTGPGDACGGALATIDVGDRSLGEILEELAKSEIIYGADPISVWDFDLTVTEALAAVGVPTGSTRDAAGAGVRIAVIDTGVSANPQLSGRLEAGYDFVDEDTDASDGFKDEAGRNHGSTVALLAAGSASGVAPGATVLPLRACDENGICHADKVFAAVCYALETSKNQLSNLVLNLSLGGDTPVEVLERALAYALNQGTLVAAAGGNQGKAGSPRHYPAAAPLGGLVAVGALAEQRDATGGIKGFGPAEFSTRGNYLDVSAPGEIVVSSVTPAYQGTSFATPLVAGGLAAWRQAHPQGSAKEAETFLKTNVQPLPFSPEEVGAGMLNLKELF